MSADADIDHTRIRLEEIRDDIRTVEAVLPDPLTLESAIRDVTATLEAYERLERDVPAARDGGR